MHRRRAGLQPAALLLSYLPKHGYGARIRTQTNEVQSLACCRYTTPQQNWWPRSDSNRHYTAFETAASAIWATGLQLVPKEGVEPPRPRAVVSKTTVSSSSTTSAFILCKKKAFFLLTESLEEGRGFEPLSLTGQRFSRPPHYLTLPTFLGWAGRNRTLASRFKRPLHLHSATTQDGPFKTLRLVSRDGFEPPMFTSAGAWVTARCDRRSATCPLHMSQVKGSWKLLTTSAVTVSQLSQ